MRSINKGFMRPWISASIRISIAAFILYMISRNISYRNILTLLTPNYFMALSIGVILTWLQALFCTIRWRLILKNEIRNPSLLFLFSVYMEGLYINQAVPSFIGGDTLRIMRLRKVGLPANAVINSVLRDRLFGAIASASLSLLASLEMKGTPVEDVKVWAVAIPSISLLAMAGFSLVLLDSSIVKRFVMRTRLTKSILLKIGYKTHTNKSYILCLFYSYIGQIISGLVLIILGHGLAIHVGPMLLIGLSGVVVVISILPISLAGWGLREATVISLLVPLGVDYNEAALLGASFGIVGVFSALLGGLTMFTGLSEGPRNEASLN